MRGEIFWSLVDMSGRVTRSGVMKNVVTLDAGILIARLIKSTSTASVSEPRFGVRALAVGTGDVGWNLQRPPSANNLQRSLFNEIGRTTISSSSYVTSDGSISLIPTNVVDFNFIFGLTEAVGPLTEMGLIGGDLSDDMAARSPVLPANGTYDPTVNMVGKDTLMNYRTFPVVNKPPTEELRYTWRISL